MGVISTADKVNEHNAVTGIKKTSKLYQVLCIKDTENDKPTLRYPTPSTLPLWSS